MKWKLYILLFGLIVFLGETMSIPIISNGNSGKKMCAMHKTIKSPAKKDCCSHKSKPTMNCIDCPLCYITVSTSTTSFFILTINNKIEYSDFVNTNLSGYHNESWKPPDA